MTGALLTMVFASGCQTPPPDRPMDHAGYHTIHVPPGGAGQSPDTVKTIIDIDADGTLEIQTATTVQTPNGNTIRIPAGSTINVPQGSTIHVPPGGNGANEVSKDGSRRRRRHHPDSEPMMTAPAPITHPGG